MTSDFLVGLSRDLAQLLQDGDDYNVIIKAGEGNNVKSFKTHSAILRARCPYFRAALSSNWVRKEGDYTIFKKPNISPSVFDVILKYIYTGTILVNPNDPYVDILELLVAADELMLVEYVTRIQDHLLIEETVCRVKPYCAKSAIFHGKMYGPVFGSSDLEMKEQFNKGVNCWSQEYTYERKVTNEQNFCVDEYEVFQIIKKDQKNI
ncbi:12700_t:CDS:2 [Funneliformis geosporum]|nr:12700_t:CDS:2 [Funneliformis geosporum]